MTVELIQAITRPTLLLEHSLVRGPRRREQGQAQMPFWKTSEDIQFADQEWSTSTNIMSVIKVKMGHRARSEDSDCRTLG